MPNPTDPKLWQTADQALALLSTAVPMLLLPVRLETRWTTTELLVRVYPDVPHTDALERALTADERSAGEALWAVIKAQTGWKPSDGLAGAPQVAADWRALVAAAGPWRAAWILRASSVPFAGRVPVTPFAALLPACWAFVARIDDKPDVRAIGAPIPADLQLMPDFEAADPLAAPGARWLSDFPEAERVGMAIRLPAAPLKPAVASLTVVGVYTAKTDTKEVQTAVERLFDNHRYSRGIGVVTPGTPTNRTDDAAVAATMPDPDDLWIREHTHPGRGPVDLTGGLLSCFDADSDARAARRAMQTALWPVTWGAFFSELRDRDGKPLIGEHLATLAEHFREYVDPDGPLPVLRLGRQPYGVLPVIAIEGKAGTFAGGLANTLKRMRNLWMKAARGVPRLDPAADDGEDGRPPAFLRVVNTHPWPLRYALRKTIDAYTADATWSAIVAELARLTLVVKGSGIPHANQISLQFDSQLRTALDKLSSAKILDDQRAALRDVRTCLDAALQMYRNHLPDSMRGPYESAAKAAIKQVDSLRAAFETYYKRLEDPLLIAGSAAGLTATFPARALTAGRHATNDESRLRWGRPVVAAGRTCMTAIATALRGRGRPDFSAIEPASLLDELLLAAARAVDLPGREGLADAIDALRAQPSATLERLLAGTVSLATTRLDAWLTSLATRRLAELRKDTPRGLLLGAYGHLEGLAPGTRTGEGYVLMPSPAQATTAAILRSAFNVYGGAASSPYTLDLSSRRVELARSLIAAMNAGAPLPQILGQLAERLLLAGGVATARKIDEVRLWSAGAIDRTIDGLKLARSLRGGEDLRPDEQPTPLIEGLRGALAELTDVFDAVADVGVFDATHHVLQRDTARAGAVLEALDRGELAPRPPASLETPRSGAVVRHYLVALLPGGAGTGWGTRSLAARLAPPLERWAAHWLGAPDKILFDLKWRRGDATGGLRRNLAGTLGALDLVRLSAAPAQLTTDPLAELLRRISDVPPDAEDITLDPAPTGLPAGSLALTEAVALGHALRGLLGHARPLIAADLPTAGAEKKPPPFAAAIADWLAEGPGDLRSQATAGLEPAIAGLTSDPTDHPSLAADLRAQLVKASTGDAEALSALGLAWVPALRELMDPLPGAAAATQEQLQSWLAGLARVRPACATLESSLRLVDALRDTPTYGLIATQTPEPAGAWVGHTRPAGAAAEWRSWAVVRPAGLASGPQYGLVVDEWTERLPAGEGVAGLAFHWNAPAARAPQTLLLALSGKPWTLAGLAELVARTVEDARLRLVEQEHLDTFEDLLPAIFLRGPIALSSGNNRTPRAVDPELPRRTEKP